MFTSLIRREKKLTSRAMLFRLSWRRKWSCWPTSNDTCLSTWLRLVQELLLRRVTVSLVFLTCTLGSELNVQLSCTWLTELFRYFDKFKTLTSLLTFLLPLVELLGSSENHLVPNDASSDIARRRQELPDLSFPIDRWKRLHQRALPETPLRPRKIS